MEKILLADDDESVMNLYMSIIHNNFSDYFLESFLNGNALIERLERDVSDVALVLTDNSMPGFTGSEIIRKYARDIRFERIPFILASGDDGIERKAIENGAFALIKKPASITYFINLIQTALDKYK